MSTLSIKIGAVLDGSFNTVINGSSGQLTNLGKTIDGLNSSMKSISQFKKLRGEVSNRRESWFNLDKQAQSLAAQIKTTDKPTKALTAKLDKINLSATKAKDAFLKKREALLAMTKEVRSSGHDIKSFINSQSKLETSISKVRSQYNRLGSAIRKHQSFLANKAHFKSQIIETIGLGRLCCIAPRKTIAVTDQIHYKIAI